MKNVFKIATLSAMVMLAGNVAAETATAQFQWNGDVPVLSVDGTDLVIVDTSTGGNLAGKLVFDVDATTEDVSLLSATPLSFNVEMDDGTQASYFYAVERLAVSAAGGAYLENTGDFELSVDGTAIDATTGTVSTDKETILNLTSAAATLPNISAGDIVVVQAAVLISDVSI